MRSPVATAIAIAVGLVILLGYFLAVPVLDNLRAVLLDWAIILAAVAALIGVLNLLVVHGHKINTHHSETPYSLILIVAFFVTFVMGIWDMVARPARPLLEQAVNAVQIPVETSLMAILTITLAFAAMRILRRRRDAFSIVFFVSILVFLLLGSGLLGIIDLPFIPALSAALERLPVAGARGILFGVALGALATGIRVLVGMDRPYGS